MPAVFTIPAVFKAVDKISATQKRMQKSVKNFSRSARADMQRASLAFQKFNNRVKSVGKRITKSIGSIGVAFAGLALIGVMGGMINVFADFEQANAGLAAVMNVTVKENKALTEDAKRLGSITAKTSSEVVGLQEAFARLGFERQSILNMTQATISGAVAMKAELADTAELVGAMVKTFDALSSRDAGLINDQMVKSTQKSALNFEKLSTALPIVGGAANSLKIPFTRTLALLGKLSDAGIDASMSATALRKIFTTSASKGVPYQKLLEQVANSENSLATATKLFGRTAAVQADILAKNLSGVKGLDLALQDAAGTAQTAADKQLNTLQGRLTILGSAWEGFILSVESGDGKFAKFLKTTVEVATQFLSMATGTAKAKDQLTEAELRIRTLAEKLIKFLKILGAIAKGYAIMIAMQATINIGLKAYMVLTKVGHFLKFARVFIKIARAKGIATAAQWALNFAMNANPIGLITIAVVALIGVIILMVKKWDVVKAAIMRVWAVIERNPILKILIGPIYLIIKAIQLLVKNWDAVKMSMLSLWNFISSSPIFKILMSPIFLLIQSIQFLIRNFDSIKQTVMGVVSSIVNHFVSLFELFRAVGNFLSAVFSVAYDKIVNTFIIPLQAKFAEWGSLMKVFGLKLIAPFQPLINAFASIGNAIQEHILDNFKSVGGIVTGIIDKVSNFFGSATEWINAKTEQIIKFQGTNDVTKNLANNLIDSEKGIINENTTKNLANNLIDSEKGIINENTTKDLVNNFVTNNNATERLANNFVTNENTTKNLANNFVTNENNTNTLNQNNPVIASDFNKQQPQQNNSRVDLFLNNRSSDTEIFTEGTGVNVQKTGN